MGLLEIVRAIGGLLLLFLPGFLLTYLFFGSEGISRVGRITLGFALSISLITLMLFAVNKLLGVKINLLTSTIIISVIIFAAVLASLKSRLFRLNSFLSPINISRNQLAECIGLLLTLAFAFFMAFIPHLDYAYPLHIDEWYHFGYSQALTQAETTVFAEPFLGEWTIFDHHEIGFHLFLNQIRLLTGLSWVKIFSFLPGVLFMLTVLTSFTIGQRDNFGVAAAFFVTLIPTTVRFLGPAFLTPLTLGLFFLATILFLLHCCEINRLKAVALFLLLAFLFLSHPPTGIAACVLCLIYGFLTLWKNEKRGIARWQTPLLIWGGAFVSSFVGLARFWEWTATKAAQVLQPESPLPLIYDAWAKFGFIPLGLFAVGIGFLAYKNSTKAWGLIASSYAFLTIILSFRWLEIGVFILYERSFLYLMLLAGIIAGSAATNIRGYLKSWLAKLTRKASLLSLVIVLVLVVTSGVLSVCYHLKEPYYHLITETQYNDCRWIRENLDSGYQKALVNPRMAIAFSALTGKPIYVSDASIIFWYPERLKEVDEFLRGNASDTSWLIEKDIDIVYSELPVNNPELIKLKERVYIVPEELRGETSL